MSESSETPRLVGVMNDAKWAEVRCAMLSIEGCRRPRFRVKLVGSSPADWGCEWYYHFRLDPYRELEWVELKLSPPDRSVVVAALRAVHVPGRETGDGAVVYGYVPIGEPVDYL